MNFDLFANTQPQGCEKICTGAFVLRGFALPFVADVVREVTHVTALAPLRNMHTPSGLPMSVTTTSCGNAGWVSDAYGYRYAKRDAYSQQEWPKIPECFLLLAHQAATAAGYENFTPDSCLINCYKIGAKMSLHQDKNEKDISQPVVSVSLGLPAIFLFGELTREAKSIRVPLVHGDVVVWGGTARLCFHGVLPIKAGKHSLLGEQRINLTFRKAL